MKVVVAQVESVITEKFGVLLQKEGIDVEVVDAGSFVFNSLNNGKLPDVIIVDSALRNPDAINLCRIIKASPHLKMIPILMLETVEEEAKLFASIEAGCDDIVTFPVQPVVFLARLRSLVRMKNMLAHLDDAESVLFTLSHTLEMKDKYTQGHADRVAHFAVELGKELGVKGWDLSVLYKGGMLHDIGKVAIPDAILMNPGRYTDEEFAIMKKHPVLGFEICEKLRSVSDVLPLIRSHHERLDGTGYPDRLSGAAIPGLVKIINIVDIFDALRMKRTYKSAFSLDKSFSIMWEEVEKGWWDREVLTAWEKLFRSKRINALPSSS